MPANPPSMHPMPFTRVELVVMSLREGGLQVLLARRPVDDAMHDASLAFDHAALIQRAAHALRADVHSLVLPPGFMPGPFTLADLQARCEQVLGRPLDKSSFRRKLAARGIVQALAGELRTGAFRPAQLYHLVPFAEADGLTA